MRFHFWAYVCTLWGWKKHWKCRWEQRNSKLETSLNTSPEMPWKLKQQLRSTKTAIDCPMSIWGLWKLLHFLWKLLLYSNQYQSIKDPKHQRKSALMFWIVLDDSGIKNHLSSYCLYLGIWTNMCTYWTWLIVYEQSALRGWRFHSWCNLLPKNMPSHRQVVPSKQCLLLFWRKASVTATRFKNASIMG